VPKYRRIVSVPKPGERELGAVLSLAVILHLAKVSGIVKRRAETLVRQSVNLSLREFWVLLAASSAKPVTQKQIARYLGLNQNVIVLLLDKLEKSGHVRRFRNPDNRREQFVRLTVKGRRVVHALLDDRAKHHRTILAPLSDDLIWTIFGAARAVLAFEARRSGKSGRQGLDTGKRTD
jgi:DNA-binding MarR family transcriptional regulator